MERVLSDRLPTIRLDTREVRAVVALKTPDMATLDPGAMSVRRWGSRTEATMDRAIIQNRLKTKKAMQYRLLAAVPSSCLPAESACVIIRLPLFRCVCAQWGSAVLPVLFYIL